MLAAKDRELLVAIPADQFRLDGKPRAQAKAEHPGVILSFDSLHGHLSYPCDTFLKWQDNLRAIVLSLEALRKVDRYGVTSHGEQYRGFAAIEAPRPAGGAPFRDAEGALRWLTSWFQADGEQLSIGALVRRAKRETHPDTGANAERFAYVMQAEQLLRSAGLI
jgi:hypothetical protein